MLHSATVHKLTKQNIYPKLQLIQLVFINNKKNPKNGKLQRQSAPKKNAC